MDWDLKMAKTKLLHIMALAAAVTLAGCASTSANNTGDEQISTAPVETETPDTESLDTESTATDSADSADTMDTSVMRPADNVVNFDFDQSKIRPEFRDILNQHADYLMANSGENVILEGHADERGTREYNLALGERRANAVASYLKIRGVSESQIEVVSFGEEKPVAMGNTEAAYAQNRRVEIKYQ